MSERMFPGRCEDCYKKPHNLTRYSGPMVPEGKSGEFCDDCLASRQADIDDDRTIREIGILANTERQHWAPLKPLEISFKDGEPAIRVRLKVFVPNDVEAPDASTLGMPIRIQFEENGNWLYGGKILLDAPHQRKNPYGSPVDIVRQVMPRYYFPSGSPRRFKDVRMIMEEPRLMARR